jgi:hypothetical protein
MSKSSRWIFLILLWKLHSHSCCMPCLSHSHWFNNHNSILRVQIKMHLKSTVFWVVTLFSSEMVLVSEEHTASENKRSKKLADEGGKLKLPIMLFSPACFYFILGPNSIPQHPLLKPRQFTLSLNVRHQVSHTHNLQSSCLKHLWGYTLAWEANLTEEASCMLNGIFGLAIRFQ